MGGFDRIYISMSGSNQPVKVLGGFGVPVIGTGIGQVTARGIICRDKIIKIIPADLFKAFDFNVFNVFSRYVHVLIFSFIIFLLS
jgi:hypothetical protein